MEGSLRQYTVPCNQVWIGFFRRFYDTIVRQDVGLVLPDRHVMLEMDGRPVIECPHGPAITFRIDLPPAEVDHRLDGQYQAFLQLAACSATAVIGHLRVFMQMTAQSVPYQFP